MNMQGNTVLVTGGTSGIGLALAQRLHAAGNTVAICGRRADLLRQAAERLPGLLTRRCDVAAAEQREDLCRWARAELPRLNVLINNAGVQRYPDFARATSIAEVGAEIECNLTAPIHLSSLFVPQLSAQPRAVIVQVTSGLAFVPLVKAPVYSATKAALHSFTLSLRMQLAGTSIEVVELIPPKVDTDLGIPGTHTDGMPLAEFVDAAMAGLAAGHAEVTAGFSAMCSRASRAELDAIFARMNG
ncbi:MAG TPA: SDR family NAD(P)-dependent oxidoreductase [Planctomycetota bacterium]|nr:SDR family NAD(P)-dependent oxidoreductase [Planctomycetota bacterium]